MRERAFLCAGVQPLPGIEQAAPDIRAEKSPDHRIVDLPKVWYSGLIVLDTVHAAEGSAPRRQPGGHGDLPAAADALSAGAAPDD